MSYKCLGGGISSLHFLYTLSLAHKTEEGFVSAHVSEALVFVNNVHRLRPSFIPYIFTQGFLHSPYNQALKVSTFPHARRTKLEDLGIPNI